MRKLWFASLVMLAIASPVFAQNTAVTASVRDSSNIPYSFATVAAELVPTGTAPTVNGRQVSGTAFTQADINGTISFNLWDNTQIVPANTQWKITVCESPGVQPPLGTGSQCFNITVTISGTSQSLTTQMQAAAPALTNINSSTITGFANQHLSNLIAPTAVNVALLGTDGTVAAPPYSFTSAPGTGMYLLAGGQIAFGRLGVGQFASNGGPGITSSGTVCVTTTTRCFIANTLSVSLDPAISITGGAKALQWPLVAGDPATAGWGAGEKGDNWFNTVANVPKYWDGSAVQIYGTAGAFGFAGLTSGTNTAAAMVVGTGASLARSGSGTIDASTLLGSAWSAPAAIGNVTPAAGAFTTLTSNGVAAAVLIQSGAKTFATNPIGSGACVIETAAATGVATTDVIDSTFNANTDAVTGYAPVTTGMLTIKPYPTANNVNWSVCNLTALSITPGAVTLNWSVRR